VVPGTPSGASRTAKLASRMPSPASDTGNITRIAVNDQTQPIVNADSDRPSAKARI
jgi:hypothetical protein